MGRRPRRRSCGERIAPDARHLRVRVVGTGSHRFTPVLLPDGLTLEIQVVASGGPLPTWSPDPLATGAGLIESHGGALVLSQFVLRHDPQSQIESLLRLDDSHLILYRCQLTVPPGSGRPGGRSHRLPRGDDPADGGSPGERGAPGSGRPPGLPPDRHDPDRQPHGDAGRAGPRAHRDDPMRGRRGRDGDRARPRRRGAAVLRRRRLARPLHDGLGAFDRPAGAVAGPSRGPRPALAASIPGIVPSSRSPTPGPARPSLLRVDADAFAGGCLFWQADGDAFELDHVATAGEAPAAPAGSREVDDQWVPVLGLQSRRPDRARPASRAGVPLPRASASGPDRAARPDPGTGLPSSATPARRRRGPREPGDLRPGRSARLLAATDRLFRKSR